MAVTIDRIVKVNKSVLNAGFTSAALIGNFLTENILVPADGNRTLSFSSTVAVGTYFGTTSNEYMVASKYFKSYNNNQTRPGALLFSRYVPDATAAYLFSSQLAATATVTAIKALTSPTFIAHINGVDQILTLTQADFASATGLTDIAAVIELALDLELAGSTCTIIGNNQFQIEAPSVGAATSTITYCTGNVAALLLLDVSGAPTLSQGTSGGDANFNMNIIKNYNPNWVTLSYVTRLTGDASSDNYAITIALSGWISDQDDNYIGLWWEGGLNAQNPSSTTNLRARLVEAGYGTRTPDTSTGQVTYNTAFQLDFNGINTVNPVTTDEVGLYSAFYSGMGASVNYNLVNGKINFAGKSQTGLATNVSDTTIYDNLLLQGYNVYGNFAGRASTYNLTENGSVGGQFLWLDNILDSIWLADQLQNSVATLLANTTRIPYNETGEAQILAVLSGVVAKASANGVIEKGNAFDPEQVDEVIDIVGQDITPLLTQNGYYIYFPPITAEMRVNRLPFNVNFLYTNGGAINQVIIGQDFVS